MVFVQNGSRFLLILPDWSLTHDMVKMSPKVFVPQNLSEIRFLLILPDWSLTHDMVKMSPKVFVPQNLSEIRVLLLVMNSVLIEILFPEEMWNSRSLFSEGIKTCFIALEDWVHGRWDSCILFFGKNDHQESSEYYTILSEYMSKPCSKKKRGITLSLPMTIQEALLDSVDQDQTAHSVQSDL